jgi:AcrR family transcriptional regulator
MNTALSPRKLPRQARAQVTVAAILDATAQVLVERGYAHTSTNAVAQRAGVSVGSLYQYFPNKNALIAALRERHVKQQLDVIGQQLERHAKASLHVALGAVVEATVEGHLVDMDLHRALDNVDPGGRCVPPHADEIEDRLDQQLRELLMRHRDELAVADLRLAVFTLRHMVHALVHACVLDRPARLSLRSVTREITRMALGYLTTPLPA